MIHGKGGRGNIKLALTHFEIYITGLSFSLDCFARIICGVNHFKAGNPGKKVIRVVNKSLKKHCESFV